MSKVAFPGRQAGRVVLVQGHVFDLSRKPGLSRLSAGSVDVISMTAKGAGRVGRVMIRSCMNTATVSVNQLRSQAKTLADDKLRYKRYRSCSVGLLHHVEVSILSQFVATAAPPDGSRATHRHTGRGYSCFEASLL